MYKNQTSINYNRVYRAINIKTNAYKINGINVIHFIYAFHILLPIIKLILLLRLRRILVSFQYILQLQISNK